MTAVDAQGHSARPLLEGRYRLESDPGPEGRGPSVVEAYDEASDRAVTLVLLPASSSLRDRLALRLQVRRAAESPHPGLAPVLDVLDTEATLALVLPLRPGARLLTDVGVLPEDGVEQIQGALEALHAVGRPHGALDERAVLVLPDSTVLLLPLPPEPGAQPAEDLPALARLARRYGAGHADQIPAQRSSATAAKVEQPNHGRHTRERGGIGHPAPVKAALHRPTTPPRGATVHSHRHRSSRHLVLRSAVVVCGALAGAGLADLLSRVFT
jgi:hypothetical protein